jgi:hypothetical protein
MKVAEADKYCDFEVVKAKLRLRLSAKSLSMQMQIHGATK